MHAHALEAYYACGGVAVVVLVSAYSQSQDQAGHDVLTRLAMHLHWQFVLVYTRSLLKIRVSKL